MRRWLLSFLLALIAVSAAAQGKTLRYASAFDPNSFDPHALALLYQTRIVTQIYEGLVNRGKDFKLEPSLAASWQMVNPTTWRFKLRQGVKFHDSAPFTADDAVFSIERALEKTHSAKTRCWASRVRRKSIRTPSTSTPPSPMRCCPTSSGSSR